MTKIGENLYLCLCGNEIKQVVSKSAGGGKKGAGSDMVRCPECGNLVSQKTKAERDIKIARGERV